MRPYRDIRFSADKSPYKTFIAAMIGPGYVQLNAKGLGAGSGIWEVASDQLERYRRAVDDAASGEELSSIVAAIRGRGADVMSHDTLKTALKGNPNEGPPKGRVPALQGSCCVEGLARRGMAGDARAPGEGGRLPQGGGSR